MDIASYIEHTNLNPTLTIKDVDQLVVEANQFHFLGLCVPPFWVKRAKREIGTNNILLVTVAGFPFGYSMTETKLDEIKRAIDNGADEIDVVWNISSFKTGIPWSKIEVAKCSKLTHDHQKIVKVIIETAYLSETELEQACKICADAGADFVKTSTGFAPSGAKVEDVKRMRNFLPDHVGIKASGGIKTLQQMQDLFAAGADQIETSPGFVILNEKTNKPKTQNDFFFNI